MPKWVDGIPLSVGEGETALNKVFRRFRENANTRWRHPYLNDNAFGQPGLLHVLLLEAITFG
jgi:hypothetical protein